MGIYCPQNGQTYTTVLDFEAMAATNDFGTKCIGEVSGTITDNNSVYMDGPYPHGVEFRAAIGEEFTGIEGAGACLKLSQGLSNSGNTVTDCAYELYDLELRNSHNYSISCVTGSTYYPFDVRAERCGFFNRALPAGSRTAVSVNHNTISHTTFKQTAIFRDCIALCYGNTALSIRVGNPGHGPIIAERITAITENYTGTQGVVAVFEVVGAGAEAGGNILRDIFAYGANAGSKCFGLADVTMHSGIDHLASRDTSANIVTNYLTAVESTEFEDYAGDDYRIKAASTLVGAGSGGGNIGAFSPVGGGVISEVSHLLSFYWHAVVQLLRNGQIDWNLASELIKSDQLNWEILSNLSRQGRISWSALQQMVTEITPQGGSYSVSLGEVLHGGLIATASSPLPAWRSAMTAQTWAEVGANTLSDIDPEDDAAINPNYPSSAPWHGTGGQALIVTAWCGACYDSDNDVLWLPLGGGHGDYTGNEPYKIDLSSDTPAWVMLRNPSGAVGNTGALNDGQEATGLYFDGRPRAIHSYNKPVYIPGVGPALSVQGNTSYSAAGGTGKPIILDPTTGEMSLFGATNPYAGTRTGTGACYDASRHVIWSRGASTGVMSRYDIATNTWSSLGTSHGIDGNVSLTYLPDHDCILIINHVLPNDFGVFDCQTGVIAHPALSGSFVGMTLTGEAQGRLINGSNTVALWNNSSNTTIINTLSFASNPRTDTWQIGQLPVSGANTVTPTAKTATGTYGRFFYSEKLDGFGVINATNQKIYFYARS